MAYYLFHHNLLTKCSDKFNVRDFVSKKGLSEILIPLYGVFNDYNDINFEDFPETFVLKTTNGSHTNLICTNKSDLNFDFVKKEVNSWLSSWSSKMGREWGYHNIKPKLICEKLLEKDDNNIYSVSYFDNYNKYNIELFHEDELVFNITHHNLVPKHEIVDNDIKKELMKHYKITEKQFPYIYTNDPICKYYKGAHGDLFRITRNDSSIYYRLCIKK